MIAELGRQSHPVICFQIIDEKNCVRNSCVQAASKNRGRTKWATPLTAKTAPISAGPRRRILITRSTPPWAPRRTSMSSVPAVSTSTRRKGCGGQRRPTAPTPTRQLETRWPLVRPCRCSGCLLRPPPGITRGLAAALRCGSLWPWTGARRPSSSRRRCSAVDVLHALQDGRHGRVQVKHDI